MLLSSRYMYHYVTEEGVVYLCITDDVSPFGAIWISVDWSSVQEFERSKAFLFLEDIKTRWVAVYGSLVLAFQGA